MARGRRLVRDRYSAESASVPRTPDNKRRVAELVERRQLKAGVDLDRPRRCGRRRACAAAPRRHEHLRGARPAGLGEQAHHLRRQTRRMGERGQGTWQRETLALA